MTNKIKERRIQLGIDERKIAKHINIPILGYLQIEAGKSREFTFLEGVELSNILELDIDFMYNELHKLKELGLIG